MIVIYLYLAVAWLGLGAWLLWYSWNQPHDYLRVMGGLAIVIAIRNVVIWRMRELRRRRAQEYKEEAARQRSSPKVINPEFDFSDPASGNDQPH